MMSSEATAKSSNIDGTFFSLGHPMLDISTKISLQFLQRYNLQANNVLLAQDVSNHDAILKEIFNNGNYTKNFSVGGSIPNALRTIRWLLGQPDVTIFMGCIGKDKFGRILEEQSVNCLYQKTSDTHTATCLILTTNNARSMITDLGAANRFTIDYLNELENWSYVERAKIFYVSSFFLRTCSEAVMKLAHHAMEKKKTLALNLGAEYICQKFGDQIMHVLPYVDFLFGNEQEVMCFAQCQMKMKVNNGIEHVAKELQKLLTKNNEGCVIVTRGAGPVVLASSEGVKEFSVKKPLEIVDTVGCGDAFVGGFLAYWSLNNSIDDCINAACYCAYECLSQTGCQFSNNPSFDGTQRFCETKISC